MPGDHSTQKMVEEGNVSKESIKKPKTGLILKDMNVKELNAYYREIKDYIRKLGNKHGKLTWQIVELECLIKEYEPQ